MRVRLLSFLFILSRSEALLAHPSLFFTQEEIDSLRGQEDNALEKLNLSAIVYLDKDHWSLWINHKIIRPENRHDLSGFKIEDVTPFEVKFSSTDPLISPPSFFTLRPHQSRSDGRF